MAKEAYYFSHDSNARSDPKILEMRSVYKSMGYGWYWMIIELMREQEDYSLSMQGKYVWNAFALQVDATAEEIKAFVQDCISEFKLFESDGTKFWSVSLRNRMKVKDEKSEKARKSAEARWNKTSKQANEEETQSNGNANASKSDAIKERKVKEIKVKENKINYAEYVSLTETEYGKLVASYGELKTKRMIEILDNYKGANNKKYASDYRAILNWVVARVEEEKQKVVGSSVTMFNFDED
jgi:hypothetical protein